MQAYRIVEWLEHYEVTAKGHIASPETPTENLRRGTLNYIRWKNNGHSLGPSFRKLNKKAWHAGNAMAPAAFGLFGKLLELAGDQKSQYRGWVLDEKQQPMTAESIAELLGWDVDVISSSLTILTDPMVSWVEYVTFPAFAGNRPLLPANRGSLYKEKETEKENQTKRNEKASACAPGFSDSGKPDSGAREQAIKEVCRLLRVSDQDKSNITTLRDIFEQVQDNIELGLLNDRIFERLVDEAKEAVQHRFGKWGRFINAMKREPFNYRPVKRAIFNA